METTLHSGRRRRRKRIGPFFGLLLIFLLSASAVVAWWWSTQPNKNHETPEYMANPHPIMLKGEWSKAYALGEGEGLWVPLPLVQSMLGDGVRYEAGTESIILTTDKSVLHFKTGTLDATLNRKPFALRFGAKKAKDGTLYLPFAPLKQLFGVSVETGGTSGIVTLHTPGQAIQRAVVPKDKDGKGGAKLRSGPKRSFPIVEDLPAGAALSVWGELEGWYQVQSAEGQIGYMRKKDVVLESIDKTPSTAEENEEPFVPWKLTGKRINLTWEAVYTAHPDTSKIGELTGVNVVSPTWFELLNGAGDIRSKADAGYGAWAHKRGWQVWGLFGNSFEPERTHAALATYETRSHMIQQLLAYAKTFRLQGINLDFENVYTKDKDNLVQFVRELTPLLHESGLVVSMDVSPKSNSEMWSAYLDRGRLAGALDYLILMAYDEHWASSPQSGSVASLGWTENAIAKILQEDGVPPGKLILGMPFYARQWTEKPDGNGGVKVSSKALGMNTIRQLVKDKKLKPTLSAETGQNYVEFQQDGTTQKIWLEDAVSIQARAELVKKYKLAGAASWTRSFGSEDIWQVLDKALQSYP
ncbi:glycosyl hydrolase family 18 protein [Cohnella nanjingensis]|uniref:SH3 domain-containing protein n=1 Tax=Cohnella nanjingensis TaxID=1387779 RepID=A0A7X0RUI9_9BACL|nr:glycosyl hydrolase family 18 protein [Cohnella nanjingensis]MBB6672660.1 SH3 domain-containing protein [Cohnella nanjingensis]